MDERPPERKQSYNIKERQNLGKNVYEASKDRVRNAYNLYDTHAVMFSGGKDSTIVLNVVLEVARELDKLPLQVIYLDEEIVNPETTEYVERVAQIPDIDLRWCCWQFKFPNNCNKKIPYWFTWDENQKDLWVREKPTEFKIEPEPENYIPCENTAMGKWLFPESKYGEIGNVAQYFGIRAQESLIRLRAVSKRETENYIIRDVEPSGHVNNVWKIYPIYDWKTQDVWTAPKMFDWDYNHSYDLMEKLGISHGLQRVAPPFGNEPLQRLWVYAICYPEMWDKMIARVPGANTAGMYAKTQAYGFRGVSERPDGWSYEDWIAHLISKHSPENQVKISTRLKAMMDWHFNQIGEPIPDHEAHPVTGLSWDFMVMIAQRGDIKQRRSPEQHVDGNVATLYRQKKRDQMQKIMKGDDNE